MGTLRDPCGILLTYALSYLDLKWGQFDCVVPFFYRVLSGTLHRKNFLRNIYRRQEKVLFTTSKMFTLFYTVMSRGPASHNSQISRLQLPEVLQVLLNR